MDIFATCWPSLVTECTLIPGISDHEAILIVTDILQKFNHQCQESIFCGRKLLSDDFLSCYITDHPINILCDNFKILAYVTIALT